MRRREQDEAISLTRPVGISMPSFQIFTNTPASKIPDNFHHDMTEVIQNMLQKPEKFIVIHTVPDQTFTFGGTFEPAIISELCCIGNISPEKNKEYSELLCGKLSQCFNVSADRIYITFSPRDGDFVGWNSKTFSKPKVASS